MDLAIIIPIVVPGASIVGALASAITRQRGVARVTRVLGLLAATIGTLGLIASVVKTCGAMAAAGLTVADRQAMLSNGVAEALYNLVLTLIGAGPAILVGTWVLRKRAP